jgi:hypothetical protein
LISLAADICLNVPAITFKLKLKRAGRKKKKEKKEVRYKNLWIKGQHLKAKCQVKAEGRKGQEDEKKNRKKKTSASLTQVATLSHLVIMCV